MRIYRIAEGPEGSEGSEGQENAWTETKETFLYKELEENVISAIYNTSFIDEIIKIVRSKMNPSVLSAWDDMLIYNVIIGELNKRKKNVIRLLP